MAEKYLDVDTHRIELVEKIGDSVTVYADESIIERVSINYGCTDGVAPGVGATFAPSCDIVINSESIYSVSGEIARAFFVQGAVFSIRSDIRENDSYGVWGYLGKFKITEPPEYTEDYQISFHAESYISSVLDSTFIDYSLIPNYDPHHFPNYMITFEQALALLQRQFHIQFDTSQLDSYVWNIYVYMPIQPDEDKLIDITGREWLAGLAFLAASNAIEPPYYIWDDVIILKPLHKSYANRPTEDYYTDESYNSSYTCAEMEYAPKWIRLRVTKGTIWWYEGKKLDYTYGQGFVMRDKQVNSTTVYNPTITGNNVHQYKFLFDLAWVGISFTSYYYDSIKEYKKADLPTHFMPNGQFKYVPSSWEVPGFNTDFTPGNFVLLKTSYIDDYGQKTIRDNYVYIMEMSLEWTGTFNTRITSSYNGDSSGVSSSISSSATAGSGDGNSGSGANSGLINGVRIQDGTIWAQKINTHTLAADEAFIGFLNANEALLGELRAEHAYIKEMWVGNLSATSIATTLMNAEYALIGNGTIRTAIVVDEAVDNATILNLVSTYINITSRSGNMTLKDNTLLIVDDRGVPRIQIGKDANGDYDYYLWDANGKLMWSASGLAEAGIKRGVIRNDMIADNAGITGDKINNRSLVSSINSEGYKLTSSLLAYDGTGQTFESRFQEVSYNLAGVAKNADGYRLVVSIDGWVRQDSSGATIENAYLTAKIFKDEYDEENHELKSFDKTREYKPTDFLWYRYSSHKNDWSESDDSRTITTGTDQTYKGVPYHTFSYSDTASTTSRLGDVSWNAMSDNGLHYPTWDNARNCYSLQLGVADVCMGAVFHCRAKVGKKVAYHAIPYQATPLDYTGQELQANLENMDEHVIGVSGMSATEAGTHTAVVSLTDGYIWSDDTTADKNVEWVIEPGAISDVPTQRGTLTYTGNVLTPEWNNYDPNALTISGDTSGTNAGTYTAVFTPTSDYTWQDGTRDPKSVTWTIGKATGSVTLSKNSVSLTASQPSDTVTYSNATGTVTATSNDTSIATVSKSGSTLTISSVGSGETTIRVYVAESTNYTSYTATISVTTQLYSENIEKSVYAGEIRTDFFEYNNEIYCFIPRNVSRTDRNVTPGTLMKWNGYNWAASGIELPVIEDGYYVQGMNARMGVVNSKILLYYATGGVSSEKFYRCVEYNSSSSTWANTTMPYYNKANSLPDKILDYNGQIVLKYDSRIFSIGSTTYTYPNYMRDMCIYNNQLHIFENAAHKIFNPSTGTYETDSSFNVSGVTSVCSDANRIYVFEQSSSGCKCNFWNGSIWQVYLDYITESSGLFASESFVFKSHVYCRINQMRCPMYRLDNDSIWVELPL